MKACGECCMLSMCCLTAVFCALTLVIMSTLIAWAVSVSYGVVTVASIFSWRSLMAFSCAFTVHSRVSIRMLLVSVLRVAVSLGLCLLDSCGVVPQWKTPV